jgi:hypothetical protein
LVVIGNTVIKAKRWQALFFPQHLDLGKTWAVFQIGQMLNIVLPVRAGEISRIYFIGEVEQVSRAKALATVLAEKMVDLVMLALAYLAVALWLAASPVGLPQWLRGAATVVVPIASLSLAGLFLLAYVGRSAWQFLRYGRLVNRVYTFIPGFGAVDRTVEKAISTFEALRHQQTSVLLWALTLAIWGLATLTNWVLFHAFQLDLGPAVALLLLVVLMSGIAVTPLPGNLGVLPLLCQLVLSLFGVSRETALVYGLVLQLVVNLPLVVLGSACLVWENWSAHQARLRAPKAKDQRLAKSSADKGCDSRPGQIQDRRGPEAQDYSHH